MDPIETPDWYVVPVEIRPGVFALLQLPKRLTKQEGEKLSRVVLAYATDSD